MTRKRYRESSSLSRATRSRPPQRRPNAVPDHFTKAQPAGSSDPHPVDVAIQRSPKLAALRRKLVQLAKRCQESATDKGAFIAYEDSRLEYVTESERLYYNAGCTHGLTLGRAESWTASASTDPVARAFTHKIGLDVAMTDLPPSRVAAALLEVTRAVVLGLPLR